jgi:hypothetical protein
MKLLRTILVVLTALAALTTAAAARVDIRFVQPERFVDEDFRNTYTRDRLVAEFERFLKAEGARHVRAGQTLRLEVLDIDLAGRNQPFASRLGDVRVMRETTPPSVKLRYVLEERGRVVARGEETLLDWNYLSNVRARNSSEWLPYEKAMLRDWFRRRFGDLQQAGRG